MPEDIETIETPPSLPPRGADAHKGDFGRVLVVGGSRGMPGAVALAANAAFRGGAGLVTFAAPERVQLTIAGLCPCATSAPLACDGDGQLASRAVDQMVHLAGAADVLAVGPGLGVGSVQQDLVRAALEQMRPVVLDADGLNNLAALGQWWTMRRCPLVLTPHPGEFARLTDTPVAEIQADRKAAAVLAVQQWSRGDENLPPVVCVLKGAGTVVTDGGRAFINRTGNPGMAVGGSGDVLTGLTGALIGQGLAPFDAACMAADRHGRAGDLAAENLGQTSLMASDLLEFLPEAMKEAES